MKEKISMVKLTEKQAQSIKGGVEWVPCVMYDPTPEEDMYYCGCYIGMDRCAHQLWPDNNNGCYQA